MLRPRPAQTAVLPVRHTVEEKPLEAAVAGASLTFALYGDAACTTLVQSTPVAVEDVTLILKLKQPSLGLVPTSG